MTETMLSVNNVSKTYFSYRSEWIRFARWFGFSTHPTSEFKAVKNVSFDVKRGETVAIVGQNGAGKSTLLKLITGTIQATSGTLIRNGSVNAILELGLGFNPDFTGRENVHHSGGLMGMSPSKISEIMPDVESFAELGEHFDKKLRTYSSGMMARLAFALATARRPEILIVDEVLSVGDTYFSHKSFARIRKFRAEGSTILLVTHSMADVLELADRAILMKQGEVIREGRPDEIVDYYSAMTAEREAQNQPIEQIRGENGWSITRSGNYRATVKSIAMFSKETGTEINTANVGEHIVFKAIVDVKDDLPRLVLGLMIRDRTGHVVWGNNTWHSKQVLENVKAGERVAFSLNFDCNLGPGSYSVSPALVSSSTHLDDNYEWIDNFFIFEVVNHTSVFFLGTTHLKAIFEIERDTHN